ncbi:MAG: component of IIS longevity pathway SMK-1-domain-containing protein [Linnemannia gamsii]|nr:MAG: component of IIS longevity pathway SMK-1-domain-containing protein [Linnemannia gamsii]
MPVHSTDNNDQYVPDLSNNNSEDEANPEQHHDYTVIRNAIKNGLFHYKNAAVLVDLLADDVNSSEEEEDYFEDEVDSEEHHDYTFIRDAIKKGLFHYKNAAVLAELLADDDDSDDDEEDSFLPTPDITNLKQIKERLLAVEADKQVQRKMKDYIVEEEYIDKFIPVLETCESMELTSMLSMLYVILMHLINIGDASIMDQIVKDSTFECCLGILENETDLASGKANYRRMFSGHMEYRLLFPIDDPYTLRTIHQLNRLQFLVETVLPENLDLDKETAGMLRLMIKSKTVEIVQDIGFDQNFMDNLFDVMTNDTEPMRRRQNVVFFVQQLCSMAKTTKVDIYKKLDPFDFMRLLEFVAGADNARVKQAGIEILQLALDTNPNFIRSHIARRPSTNSFKGFFDTIINQSLTETDVCIMPQFTESIRTLLDIKSELTDEDNEDDEDLLSERTVVKHLPSERTVAKRLLDLTLNNEKFLSIFYEQFLSCLVAPLLQLTKDTTALDPVTYARCESACSLLSSAVRIHPERIKDLLVSSRVYEKLCLLFKNDSKHLRLMALNFFRICLKHKENCFN